jgi:RNA polymerase sigma-70 factor (ECF subfamily)
MPESPSRSAAVLNAAEEIRLISGAKHGDPSCFERLVEHFMPRAIRVAHGYTRNREDAVDMAQEAFFRVYKSLERFRDGEPFAPWFFRILRNTCWNYMDRRRTARALSIHGDGDDDRGIELRDPDPASGPESAERAERRRRVWEAMHTLSVNHREILVLRHFEDMDYATIAEVLDIPIGTVMSRLFHARKKLAAALETYELGKAAP